MTRLSKTVVRLIVGLGQKTVLGRGSSRSHLLKIIRYIDASPIDTFYHGVPFQFNLDNTTERQALFGRYNYVELTWLLQYMQINGVFVDIGANSGLYTQFIAARAPQNTHVVAIEPNPKMVARIQKNLSLIPLANHGVSNRVSIEPYAVGRSAESAFLGLEHGFGEAHVVDHEDENTIPIRVLPLLDILEENKIDYINGLKIDIEGYEDVALVPFFKDAPRKMYPRAIVIEHTSQDHWKVDVLRMLGDLGYREVARTRGNALLELGVENRD